ncbi:MAG: hypothetical protein IK080_08320 [Clostridia bacterium]|nr:hypothetical protein [Clostridia bacterium]
MMKKWLPLLLCCVLLLGGCGGRNAKTAADPDAMPEGYIPEGIKSILTQLVNANDYFVREAFVQNHLPTDAADAVTQEGEAYERVAAGRVTSFEALESLLRATYQPTVAENLLAEGVYAEIDGKLYCCMPRAPKTAGSGETEDFTIENGSISENEITFDVVYAGGTRVTMTAKNSDGVWRLTEFYEF